MGRKRIRKHKVPLTTIPVSDEVRNLLSTKKGSNKTYDDFLREMLGI